MKVFESVPSEKAICRVVCARFIAGVIVLIAFLAAPAVFDSIATGSLTSGELSKQLYSEPAAAPAGVDVQKTEAAPVEPLSMSY